MKMAKNDPKRAQAILKPRENAFLEQKTYMAVHLGPKNHLLWLKMPANCQNGYFAAKFPKLKLMLY